MVETRMPMIGVSATGVLLFLLGDVGQYRPRCICWQAKPSVSTVHLELQMVDLEHTGLCTSSESSLARASDCNLFA
jgi:hypothetical protein